jgi:hypothetical protein
MGSSRACEVTRSRRCGTGGYQEATIRVTWPADLYLWKEWNNENNWILRVKIVIKLPYSPLCFVRRWFCHMFLILYALLLSYLSWKKTISYSILCFNWQIVVPKDIKIYARVLEGGSAPVDVQNTSTLNDLKSAVECLDIVSPKKVKVWNKSSFFFYYYYYFKWSLVRKRLMTSFFLVSLFFVFYYNVFRIFFLSSTRELARHVSHTDI